MKKKLTTNIATTAIASGLLAFSSVSSAAPTYDFTDLTLWGSLDGTNGGVLNGLSFNAIAGSITTNASSADPVGSETPCVAPHNYACEGDGLGIGDDEISYDPAKFFQELLTISSLEAPGGAGVEIDQVSFLDVFIEGSPSYTEVASFIVNGDTSIIYSASAMGNITTNNNGFVEWNGSITGVNSITFGVVCSEFGGSTCSDNDFSIAGVNVVPVPAALWLFGSGLIGLVGIARNKRKVA